jgi:pseudomonalisin
VLCNGLAAGEVVLAREADWVTTHTRAPPTQRATWLGALSPSEAVSVVVSLKPRHQDQLDAMVEDVSAPWSPTFRRYLTPEQVLEQFAPTEAQARQVTEYLIGAGFTHLQVAPNRMLVGGSRTADAVRRAFHTTLARFSREGRQAFANTTDVKVPRELGDIVQGFKWGLLQHLTCGPWAPGRAAPR